jgi:excisionase family DNA binding protein
MAISERSIWNLVKQGKLPAVRFGKIMRIERGDLDQFIRVAKTGDPHESFLAASNLRGGREQ